VAERGFPDLVVHEAVAARGLLLQHLASEELHHRGEQLCAIASRSASDLAEPSVVAAHLAVVEAAALLEGQPPVGKADRSYVDARTRAITEVATNLAATPERTDSAADRRRDAAQAARASKVAVREEIEAATDLGALGRLRRLETRFEREADPDPEP
jgi:hypothetical protein